MHTHSWSDGDAYAVWGDGVHRRRIEGDLQVFIRRGAARQLSCVPGGFMFCFRSYVRGEWRRTCTQRTSYFLIPRIISEVMADRHQTLPRVRWSPGFTTVRQKFGVFSPPKNGRPKTSKLRRDFGQLRDLIATLEYPDCNKISSTRREAQLPQRNSASASVWLTRRAIRWTTQLL